MGRRCLYPYISRSASSFFPVRKRSWENNTVVCLVNLGNELFRVFCWYQKYWSMFTHALLSSSAGLLKWLSGVHFNRRYSMSQRWEQHKCFYSLSSMFWAVQWWSMWLQLLLFCLVYFATVLGLILQAPGLCKYHSSRRPAWDSNPSCMELNDGPVASCSGCLAVVLISSCLYFCPPPFLEHRSYINSWD